MLELCLKIFLVRIIDVSLGTLRTIFSVKGKSIVASLIGFIEVTIWFLIVREALNTDSNSLWVTFSYAAGFATGTYIGGMVSKKFINGNLGVQIITDDENEHMITELRKEGYAVSIINIKGQDNDDKYMLFVEITNKNFEHLKRIVKSIDDKAFIVVNETKFVQNGYLKK